MNISAPLFSPSLAVRRCRGKTLLASQRSHGFTLIELLIVVAVVAILSAVAMPSYSGYMQRSKISEAVTNLSDMRMKLEQFFQDKRTYVGACVTGTVAPLPDTSAAKYFSYTCTDLTANTYQIVATGNSTAGMANFTYSVDQANSRTTVSVPNGWTAAMNCWTMKRDGSC
jgi:type IV pilus assembly protein PilE